MTAALEGGEWSTSRLGRSLTLGKTRYPLNRRLGGPQGWSGRAENLVPTVIWSRTVQPVVSRYTDWATRSIYIYIYVCVCVCVCARARTRAWEREREREPSRCVVVLTQKSFSKNTSVYLIINFNWYTYIDRFIYNFRKYISQVLKYWAVYYLNVCNSTQQM